MSNPVLDETGDFALSVPLTLIHYGGSETATRGVIARLPQSEGQLSGAFSESARNAYVSTPTNRTRVRTVRAADAEGTTHDWFVLDSEIMIGALFGSLDQSTTRYMLRDGGVEAGAGAQNADYDPTDYDPVDYN